MQRLPPLVHADRQAQDVVRPLLFRQHSQRLGLGRLGTGVVSPCARGRDSINANFAYVSSLESTTCSKTRVGELVKTFYMLTHARAIRPTLP